LQERGGGEKKRKGERRREEVKNAKEEIEGENKT
jgi:hypothetical protein